MKTTRFLILFLLLTAGGCATAPEVDHQQLQEAKKIKTDQDRVEDIHRIAALIEKYRELNGNYPFREYWDNVPQGMQAVPIIMHASQYPLPEEFRKPPTEANAYLMPVVEFEAYLSEGLGERIVIPRDDRPLETPDGNWPFFYQFQYDGQNYFVACYLSEELPFSRKLSENLYKYEVGSVAIPERQTQRFLDIWPLIER